MLTDQNLTWWQISMQSDRIQMEYAKKSEKMTATYTFPHTQTQSLKNFHKKQRIKASHCQKICFNVYFNLCLQ